MNYARADRPIDGCLVADTKELLWRVTPRAGQALIFNHDTYHEGEPVLEGVKYILRTEARPTITTTTTTAMAMATTTNRCNVFLLSALTLRSCHR